MLTIQVIYDGLGEILQWFAVTDGSQLSDDFVIENSPDVMILKTSDGGLSFTTLKSALVIIRRLPLYVKKKCFNVMQTCF